MKYFSKRVFIKEKDYQYLYGELIGTVVDMNNNIRLIYSDVNGGINDVSINKAIRIENPYRKKRTKERSSGTK